MFAWPPHKLAVIAWRILATGGQQPYALRATTAQKLVLLPITASGGDKRSVSIASLLRKFPAEQNTPLDEAIYIAMIEPNAASTCDCPGNPPHRTLSNCHFKCGDEA